MIRLVIFDLDGTLIDSKLDLAHSVNATRAHLALPPLPHEQIFSYVGNGAPVLIRRSIEPDAPGANLEAALDFFVSYYFDHRVEFTSVYPGVPETLKALAEKGIAMAILTNKPVRISHAILDDLGISGYFRRVYGGNSFEQKKPHPIGIQTLLAETATEPQQALMVGDSAVDIQTARNAGVPSCGVTFGFQPESLTTHPPDFLLSRMEELLDVVDRKSASSSEAM
ncbi:MAG TPA: phosphoglycolate phosphatase, partial [Bryobacteraceae bacterium]|nr:phosphoglycolate phosphatase [Bryobacteraceae bacterium]